MSRKMLQKRGLKKDIPRLDEGEFGFTTDEKKAYIGTKDGNVKLLDQQDKQVIDGQVAQISSQLAETGYNVKTIGAKMDGVTNDRPAIQSFIDKLNGQKVTIYLPPGEIYLDGSIILRDNVTIQGAGVDKTTLKSGSNSLSSFFVLEPEEGQTLKNVTIKDFYIDGSNKVNSASMVHFIRSQSKGNLENITIENVKINATGDLNTCVTFSSDSGLITNLKVKDCHFTATGKWTYGINIRKPNKHVWVQNNFVSLPHPEAYNNIAIYADSTAFHVNHNTCVQGGHSPIAVSTGTYGEIIGNYVEGANYTGEGAIEVEWKDSHGGLDTSHHVVVLGNVIKNAYYGVMVTSRGGEPRPIHAVIVSNNIITNCNTGLYVYKSKTINLLGNTLDNCVIGAHISFSTDILVSNNSIEATQNGINVGQDVQQIKINDNKIYSVANVNGIKFSHHTAEVMIVDNEIILTNTSPSYCPIKFEVSAKDCLIANNFLRGGISSLSFDCLSTTLCDNVSIINNTFVDFLKYGVYLARPNNTNGQNKNIKINGNSFRGSAGRVTNFGLIYVLYADRVSINDNSSDNNTGRSVYVEFSNAVLINNNCFIGDYTLGTGSLSGVRVANATNITIVGNFLKDQKYSPINITGTVDKVVIANNIIDGSDDRGITLAVGTTNCLVMGNMLSNILGANKINNAGTNNELLNNKIIA